MRKIVVEVYRDGSHVKVDGAYMNLTQFRETLPEYKKLGRDFDVCPACWLVSGEQVSRVKRMVE
jgi:hypothetical protein